MLMNHKYHAYIPDENGYINYTEEENQTWEILYNRQTSLIRERACSEYLDGINALNINSKKIPQPVELSKYLKDITGWEIKPVLGVTGLKEFFYLLSERKFPAASFIRRMEHLDYLTGDPDVFHEIFGHCPMLTDPNFAKFNERIGQLSLGLSKKDLVLLGRFYWFTVEFGLIKTQKGPRIYGAGILSSKTESVYALEDPTPERKKFDLIDILCTPYRYGELQNTYFIIQSFDELYAILDLKLTEIFKIIKELDMNTNGTLKNEIRGKNLLMSM